MKRLIEFKAVYCSGCLIHDPSLIPALALLFERVHLPRNLDFIRAFSKKYRFAHADDTFNEVRLKITPLTGAAADDPFADLTPAQRTTAHRYIKYVHDMVGAYHPLFPAVFETELFPDSQPLEAELVEEAPPGQGNLYRVSLRRMLMTMEDEETVPKLISDGYVPVVTDVHIGNAYNQHIDDVSARQLAALLGMASIGLVLPKTRAAHPEVILEARERLSDQVPPFWSSMFKLTDELKNRITETQTQQEAFKEAHELVDSTVLPSLIDLQSKLEKDKKLFFYRILAPIQKGLRLLIGNPPVTQQQLLTNALILGSDVAMSAAGQMQTIEALKKDAGLTFLLELGKMWSDQ